AYQGIFQALEGGMESLIISVLRQLVLVLPVAFAFSALAMRNTALTWTIWTTFIIAEVVSCIVATLLYRKMNRKVIATIE
ncbi:MAG: MATE family efflux transporter, partial [Eubacterium sp.]|nr:MATE family efflux transporter [Eubacterium sp.]